MKKLIKISCLLFSMALFSCSDNDIEGLTSLKVQAEEQKVPFTKMSKEQATLKDYLKCILISRPMCVLTKFVCLFLPLLLLSSCSNSEEPDYPVVASSIFNNVLIDVLDSFIIAL